MSNNKKCPTYQQFKNKLIILYNGNILVNIFRILGPPALQYHMNAKEGLIHKKRPIYNYSMKGVITCFTGIRNKGELVSWLCYGGNEAILQQIINEVSYGFRLV